MASLSPRMGVSWASSVKSAAAPCSPVDLAMAASKASRMMVGKQGLFDRRSKELGSCPQGVQVGKTSQQAFFRMAYVPLMQRTNDARW